MTDTNCDVERLICAECERLRQLPAWQVQAVQSSDAITGALLRALRIAAGIAMLYGAYLVASWGWPAIDKPFAALTIRDLCALVGGIGMACFLVPSAFTVAFGERAKAASRTVEERARSNVMETLQTKAREAAQAQAAEAQQRERVEAERIQVARWYSRGKWIGILFDPAIARKHPWLPFAAIVVAYACIVLFAVGVPFLVDHFAP